MDSIITYNHQPTEDISQLRRPQLANIALLGFRASEANGIPFVSWHLKTPRPRAGGRLVHLKVASKIDAIQQQKTGLLESSRISQIQIQKNLHYQETLFHIYPGQYSPII